MNNLKPCDNLAYYEQFNWKGSKLNNRLQIKVQKILGMIPPDVRTIIDIGCGDGTITNRLAEKFDVTGVDRSENALAYVKTKKMLSSSDHIDVPDRSFELVFSSELLEHLEKRVFFKTIEEMKRISRRYILLTVPNGERVEKDFVECLNCGQIFNRSHHLRSLSVNRIKECFFDWRLVQSFEFGSGKRGYSPFLLKIKHTFVPSSSWIPKYWTRGQSRETMCPRCETQFTYGYKFNLLGFLCDFLNIFFSPHRPYWLFVLLEKV